MQIHGEAVKEVLLDHAGNKSVDLLRTALGFW
jgi:hypothetical protein